MSGSRLDGKEGLSSGGGRLAAATLFLLTTSPASATVLFHAQVTDAGVGDWDEFQSWSADGTAYSSERIGAVPSPIAGEHQVIRIALKNGDMTFNPRKHPPYPMGNRSELVRNEKLGEGDDRWYRWRIYFPKDFSVTDGKDGGAVFAQWHHWNPTGEPGSPPILFVARADDLRIVSVPVLGSEEAITLASAAQKKGHWRTFVVHIRFASDAHGLIEWWLDSHRVQVTQAPTLFPGYSAYLKMGLYRRPSAREDNVIYLDDVMEATNKEDVMPR